MKKTKNVCGIDKPFFRRDFGSTLLDNQLYSLIMSKIQKGIMKKDSGDPMVMIRAAELREIFEKNDGSFYNELKTFPEKFKGRKLFVFDLEMGMTGYVALFTYLCYKSGILCVKINSFVEPLFNAYDYRNFEKELKEIKKFKSPYSFSLYDILKEKIYLMKKTYKRECEDILYEISMTASELRLEIGVVNSKGYNVAKILANTSDYDMALEGAKEYAYERWSSFKSRVLDVAIKEINENTDLFVKYQAEKGYKNKVKKINFDIIEKVNSEK